MLLLSCSTGQTPLHRGQILEKGCADPHRAAGREVACIGIEFSGSKRNILAWDREHGSFSDPRFQFSKVSSRPGVVDRRSGGGAECQ